MMICTAFVTMILTKSNEIVLTTVRTPGTIPCPCGCEGQVAKEDDSLNVCRKDGANRKVFYSSSESNYFHLIIFSLHTNGMLTGIFLTNLGVSFSGKELIVFRAGAKLSIWL